MPMTRRTATAPKVKPLLIIGVSGATWGVLSPLKARGRTPNIARLLERGTGANLVSVRATGDEHYRPQTAWPSLATGVHPDRHGVTRFFHEAGELRAPTLWRIYAERGLSSGIYGWPGTWPPPQIPGFVVPSHLARDSQTWPPDLRDLKALDREQQSLERDGGAFGRLRGAFSAGAVLARRGLKPRTFRDVALIAPGAFFGDFGRRRLLLRRMKLEISRDMFLVLYRRTRPDLAAFVTFYVDFISHRYWRYRDLASTPDGNSRKQRFYAQAVDQGYEIFDRVVGDLVTAAGPESIVAIVSEHGMDPEPVSAEVGGWYYTIRGSRVHELAGLDPEIRAHPIARWVAFRPVSAATSRGVADRLRQVFVAETGLPLFRVYEHGDEVVIKFRLDREVPRYADGDISQLNIRIGEAVVPFLEVGKKAGPTRSAMHARDGILVIAGPNIRRDYWAGEASILDIAPTLLKAVGIKPDLQFDGAALEIFG
jgi:predicted AlkP superfamily phosphohydrolase/phosphomutase